MSSEKGKDACFRRNKVKEVNSVNEFQVSVQNPRLSAVLFEKQLPSFASLATLGSNVDAIEAGLLFATGYSNFVAVVGASGWGKSHLLSAVEQRVRQEGLDCPAVQTAEGFLEGRQSLNMSPILILDDCQEVLTKLRPRTLLRLTLEHRVRAGRPTLLSFTNPRVTRAIRAFLPHTREWTVSLIGAPEPADRVLLINQMASDDGLVLSPNLVLIIARHMHGNGRTLSGALKRLLLSNTQWLDGHACLRACGLLDPFFADNSSWDLKHKIIRTAEAARTMFPRLNVQNLAIFAMLRIASLCEADVAGVLDVEPSAVYLRACRFEREMARDPAVGGTVQQFVDLIVNQLAHD
jgi:hypothetical protein